ncbi:hypothetical protein L873DRAFT_1789214 [Choiromyces venosus 120613-1]|uniref:Helitron helicase-like domain-containing protein n=1 Tax=Choiromyces venosus 120613-1 TaxID=1336337 RepID=A0A3N4JP87_9PEZI|nr:hypothetical protein L873DRAFT_1789214 [Choiromyces venosus 120613-1]
MNTPIMQRCYRCRQEKGAGDFDRDVAGILHKACRNCLLSQRNRRNAVRVSNLASGDAVPMVAHPPSPTLNLAFTRNRAYWTTHNLGTMNIVCVHCHAKHWKAEPSRRRQAHGYSFESCCKHGDVVLEKLKQLPEPLNSLMDGTTLQSKNFLKDVRRWNGLFAFTSISYNMDNRTTPQGGGLHLFQVHGAVYHLQGPLKAPTGRDAAFSQIYLYDPLFAAQACTTRAEGLDTEIILALTQMFQECSPLIQMYKTAKERMEEAEERGGEFRIILNPQMQLVIESGADRRRENLPTSDEVALILPEEYGEAGCRDLVLAKRDNSGPMPGQYVTRTSWHG